MLKELKLLPNKITFFRLILIPLLWILAIFHYKKTFAILITIAGITDALDGFFARALKQETKFGAWFDSITDNLILISSPFWIWIIFPNFFLDNLTIILIIIGLLILSLALGFIKYHKMIDYHLYLNKFAAILFYLFLIHALIFDPNIILFYLTLFIAGLACTEEILITLINKKMQPDKLSIFNKRNK